MKRIFSVILVILSCCLLSSCTHDKQNNELLSPENRYYSSRVYTFDSDGYSLMTLLSDDTNKYAILNKYDSNANSYKYKLSAISGDTADLIYDTDIDNQGEILGSFCLLGNKKVVASTYYGYIIFDTDTGSVISRNDDLYVIINENIPQLYQCEDGFVVVKGDCIYRISENGNVLSQVTYEEEGTLTEENSYFGIDGKDYLALESNLQVQYYEIDFDKKEIAYLCNNNDLGLDFDSVYRTGKFAYDDYSGTIYMIDPSNKSKEACSYTRNMLIMPMVKPSGFDPRWYVFNESDYAILYRYSNDCSEIVFVRCDDTLNIQERTTITIKGYEANSNIALCYAAYLYNTSQNEYLVTIENYSLEEYGYSTAEEAQRSKLKLIQDFSNGNAPDIFYGNGFDYDQMGRSGLVMDIRTYLEDCQAISEDTILPQIYGLFLNDGHCYKLFPGFSMFGLWSSEEATNGNINMSIEDIGKISYSKRIFSDYYASDLVDFSVRYPINKLVQHGSFPSEEEFIDIIKFAIVNGRSPEVTNTQFADASSIASHEYSLFLDYIGGANIFASTQRSIKDHLCFVGFPTVSGSVHVAYPYGLVAVSAGTKYPDECMQFINILFSDEVQKAVCSSNYIPVCKKAFEDSIKENHLSVDESADYSEATGSVDTVMINDWGMYTIIAEEVNSYYLQNRSIEDIAHSLRSRLLLYCKENGIV